MVQNDLCTSDIWTYQWMKNNTRLLIGDSYLTNKEPTGSHQWSGLKVRWRLTLSMLTFLCIILMGNFCPAKLFSFPLSVWGTSIQSESWTKLSLDWSFDHFNLVGTIMHEVSPDLLKCFSICSHMTTLNDFNIVHCPWISTDLCQSCLVAKYPQISSQNWH